MTKSFWFRVQIWLGFRCKCGQALTEDERNFLHECEWCAGIRK